MSINVNVINAMKKNIVTLAPEGNTVGENPMINLEAKPPRNMKRGNKSLGNALTSIMQLLINKYKEINTMLIEFMLTLGIPS